MSHGTNHRYGDVVSIHGFYALYRILSWSWLNIWFEPMRWFVLDHVTGISSATTTCQPRSAKHDLCVSLAFEIIKNCIKIKILESYWYGNSFFNFHSRWENHLKWYSFHYLTLAFFQKLLLLCLTQVLKVMLKMHIYMHKIMSNISMIVLVGIMLINLSNGRIYSFS